MRWFFLFLVPVCFSFVDDSIFGEYLEAKMWDYVNNKNWDGVGSLLADSYQGVNYRGISSRQEDLNFIKNLRIKNYLLSNFVIVRDDDIMVVAYQVSYTNSDGTSVHESTPRLAVWQEDKEGWKVIAYVNFKK